jgi:hypothetical protein
LNSSDFTIEEYLGTFFVAGQRHQVLIRSVPDTDGTWHNAVVFRRDGKLSAPEVVAVGVDWHVPPGVALQRASEELGEKDQIELYRRALRPRPPLL